MHLEFAKDNESIDYAMKIVARGIHLVSDFLKTKRFVHFDAHFGNYIADGKRLYLTDFGLALSEKFDLSVATFPRKSFDGLHCSRCHCQLARPIL